MELEKDEKGFVEAEFTKEEQKIINESNLAKSYIKNMFKNWRKLDELVKDILESKK